MLPLELQRQVQKVRRRKEAYQSIANDDSSSDNWENSEVDPDYEPSVDDVNWTSPTSPKHTPRKRQKMESDPQESVPLKYMQVSVEAMRVITRDPEQSECAHEEHSYHPAVTWNVITLKYQRLLYQPIPRSVFWNAVLLLPLTLVSRLPLNLCQRNVEGKGGGMSVHGKMFRERNL
ncbi:hypothetical protein ElyMa_000208100 [Elysia marginata]|uniref:Uncharacterized protein n=1 Tax=Elysia marginata TaxID=1093978 RepID=A0AAV4EXC4_9GAST|nr:hypothetical protein ElyMa_000208100 [Elysia marginata]